MTNKEKTALLLLKLETRYPKGSDDRTVDDGFKPHINLTNDELITLFGEIDLPPQGSLVATIVELTVSKDVVLITKGQPIQTFDPRLVVAVSENVDFVAVGEHVLLANDAKTLVEIVRGKYIMTIQYSGSVACVVKDNEWYLEKDKLIDLPEFEENPIDVKKTAVLPATQMPPGLA